MLRLLQIFFLALCPLLACGAGFPDETLHYVISYKWGLIHKDAGDATLSLRRVGPNYSITLTAKTKPWADGIYSVRDTLRATVSADGLKPLSYAKITHEKGKYKVDEITYSTSGTATTGNARRIRFDDGKRSVTEKTFSATGPVYDMLSVFYYLRSLNFSQLAADKVYKATVFSGWQKETINIRYLGLETIKLKDKSQRRAYHIRFNFTRDGGKKSSEDMDTWISTDPAHIPLYLVAHLPVGEVRAYLQ